LLHFLNNGLSILGESQTSNFPLAPSLEATYQRGPFLFLLSAGLVLALVGLAFFQSRYQYMEFDDGEDAPPSRPLVWPGNQHETILFREPIPPGTTVLVLLATTAFGAVWALK
jgi:hypothetical protein